jgi:desulfoferrodoxin (superoxide reductase-like protein)
MRTVGSIDHSPSSEHSIATTLLMAANLVRYVTAVPEPNPEADSVRYKVCSVFL